MSKAELKELCLRSCSRGQTEVVISTLIEWAAEALFAEMAKDIFDEVIAEVCSRG